MVLKTQFWDKRNHRLAGMRNAGFANAMVRISPLLTQSFQKQEVKHERKASGQPDAREASGYPREGNNGTL